ncbi:PREDICTED: uncharacterized protein LOC105112014 [Populus euphratica]|uniref:Uncharacterized protein LOC105112014 n=1 Tax=Populus euphratica TaxID=75702 RepID=A0AAJ6T703_POPEU|nr:PREDICTED: uncharacterized protein LOC105112014 [Populus euphratica]
MIGQGLLLRSPSSSQRLQPSLKEKTVSKMVPGGERRERNPARAKRQSFGEVAGGTAAGCAAVCCCCPCTVINLLVLAVYKVPVSLCKKAKKRQRLRRKQKERSLLSRASSGLSRDEGWEKEAREIMEKGKCCDQHNHDPNGETDAVDLEKEMWDQFYNTGFWRSPSQIGT